ncbi:MAG: hypothetical protein MUF14_03030 [Hyphomonadaceae bacterium]|jgi:hypothetical protein|nr:hypothetical protein [Hyphomonadaceae bacterium]
MAGLKHAFIAGAFVGLAGACGGAGGDPVRALAPADRLFLFSNTDRGVAFLGQPAEGVALSCDADAMQQGYVFRYSAASKRTWLDSLRPSGVETHEVKSIVVDGQTYEIGAVNGAGIPFVLSIHPKGTDAFAISWDGAQPRDYMRCAMGG